jgi:hypothetical protein
VELEWTTCWKGCDEGGFDEHEWDPINFGPGECITKCETCDGEGGYRECPLCAEGK